MKKFLILTLLVASTVWSQDELGFSYKFEFGAKGSENGQLLAPQSLAVHPRGLVYLADTGNNRLQEFSPRGEFQKLVGGFGWGKEQFQNPVDIFVYNATDVFIADYDNSRIERYDKDLNYIASYTSRAEWDVVHQFAFPRSVFVSLHGDIFIIDGDNNRVQKFSPSFDPEFSFGNYDWGRGALSMPQDLVISHQDLIYVSDSDLGVVMRYDYYGNFLDQIGDNILDHPQGLALDAWGNLYVADLGLQQVLIFDPAGRLLKKFGGPGDGIGAFDSPIDVDVLDKSLYILDRGRSRIQVFTLNFSNE